MASLYSLTGYFIFLFDMFLVWLIYEIFSNILMKTEIMMGRRTYWEYISWTLPAVIASPLTSIYYYFFLNNPFGSIEFFNVIIFFIISLLLFALFFTISMHKNYFDLKIIGIFIIYIGGSLFYSAEAPFISRVGNALFTLGTICVAGCFFIMAGFAREFKTERSVWQGLIIASLIFPLGGIFNSFAQNILLEGAVTSFLVLINIAFVIFLISCLIALKSITKFQEEVKKFEHSVHSMG